jgi:hypothetical protein
LAFFFLPLGDAKGGKRIAKDAKGDTSFPDVILDIPEACFHLGASLTGE